MSSSSFISSALSPPLCEDASLIFIVF